MIELGLARIQKLLHLTPQSWKAIHVAGTNGKGSICAYLTAMLRQNRVSCGSFTSPHLIDRWDCITINDSAVTETTFNHFEAVIKRRDGEMAIGATEFEHLTATAFEIFEAEAIDVGVVEVGLGGRLDATNALREKAVTVISKVAIDHQAFLGDSLGEIALQKAGIMRKGVPCVVDASNPKNVLDVFIEHSNHVGSPLRPMSPESSDLARALRESLEPHQAQNLAAAHEAFRLACPRHSLTLGELMSAVGSIRWPGRLQWLDISTLTKRKGEVLLDGAHNPQSADVLAQYVDKHLRPRHHHQPVTWILAASKGKDTMGILQLLLRPGDYVVAVEFGPVDGMPWVKAMESATLLDAVDQCGIGSSFRYDAGSNLLKAMNWAVECAQEGPLVIAGSLYLVSDVLRAVRAAPPRQAPS